jgi:transposase
MSMSKRAYEASEEREERMREHAEELYTALQAAVRKLESAARLMGNDDWAVDVLTEPFRAALAKVDGPIDHARDTALKHRREVA